MRMLATLLVPWPRPRLSNDRAAIANPSRCCLLISNASCGWGGFGCAAHAVRKMSLPSPRSRKTYAGLRSWSLDRHYQPIHALERPNCLRRLSDVSTAQLREVLARLIKLRPRNLFEV